MHLVSLMSSSVRDLCQGTADGFIAVGGRSHNSKQKNRTLALKTFLRPKNKLILKANVYCQIFF